MTANVLSVRDTNMQLKPTPSPEKDGKPKSLEYHRQVLQSRMGSEPYVPDWKLFLANTRLNLNRTQQYVSPSDEIMSPATQKLQTFKTKHAMKK